MIFDILICMIIIAAIVLGFRSGFAYTFLHTTGWIVSIVLAFAWSAAAKDWLLARTHIYEHMTEGLTEKISATFSAKKIFADSVPDVFQNTLDSITKMASSSVAQTIADMAFTILAFLAIMVLIKLIFLLLINLFSKRRRDGFAGTVDGLMGAVFGFVKGLIIVFILLALLIPCLTFFKPEMVESVETALNASTFAKELYDNNLVLLLIRSLLG